MYVGLSATEAKKILGQALAKIRKIDQFLAVYSSTKGANAATGSEAMNPFAGGGQNNLYRCFIDLGFRLVANEGNVALVHQDGHLMEPKSGAFRSAWYQRIVKHFDFVNIISAKNFSEVAHYARFSLNIYRGYEADIGFENITFAFLPSQIEESYRHDGLGLLPQFKTSNGDWDTRGHRDRIVKVDNNLIQTINLLVEERDVKIYNTRFVQPYSNSIALVFGSLAFVPSLDRSVEGWDMSGMWHETAAQKELKVIIRETEFPNTTFNSIISSPCLYVGNPLYKTPKRVCRAKGDYEPCDLEAISENYIPRTNFLPVAQDIYRRHLKKNGWDKTKLHIDFYRFALRRRVNLNMERSFIGALIPKEMAHINSIQSIAFKNELDLLIVSASWQSILYDFICKAFSRSDIIEFCNHFLALDRRRPHCCSPKFAACLPDLAL